MFFGKRHKKDAQIINEVDGILASSNIKEIERKALIRVKKRLERKEYLQRVLNDFLSDVRSLALRSQLSPEVRKFYLSIINDAYDNTGWNGVRFM